MRRPAHASGPLRALRVTESPLLALLVACGSAPRAQPALAPAEDRFEVEVFRLDDDYRIPALAQAGDALRAFAERSIVECMAVDAGVYEIAYCIRNPVAAGLCWRPEDWPGLCVLVDDIGAGALEGARPKLLLPRPDLGPPRPCRAPLRPRRRRSSVTVRRSSRT